MKVESISLSNYENDLKDEKVRKVDMAKDCSNKNIWIDLVCSYYNNNG